MHRLLSSKLLLFLFFIVLVKIGFSQNAGFYTGQYDELSWDQLLDSLEIKQQILSNKIDQATILSFETAYAESSLTTVETFICFATRDKENQVELELYYDKFGTYQRAFAAQLNLLGIPSVDYSIYSPFQILFSAGKVIDNAILEIDRQLNSEITLQEIPDFTVGDFPELLSSSSYYHKNSKPIFPSSLWGMPAEAELMKTIGYLGEAFFAPIALNSPNGVTSQGFMNFQVNKMMGQVASNQTPTQIHFTHQPLPSWMVQANPEINDFSRGFVNYDINNPLTYQYSGNMMSDVAGRINNTDDTGPVIYVLSNEPRWEIGQGRPQSDSGVSQLTIDAFIAYLQSEYGTINNLNNIYSNINGHQDFVSFQDVPVTYSIPLDIVWRGTPVWYDWMRFNMNSVTKWHQHLKDNVISSDPDAKTSIKIRGREFEDHYRDHGVDIEQLMDMQEIIGFDNHTTPRETHFRNARPYLDWVDNYTLEWREQAIMLDFSKSMYPDKPTFDSEWHGISTSAWINYSIDLNYTKSALWLAYSNGLSMMNAWWWYRHMENKVINGNAVEKGDLEPKAANVNNTSFAPLHQPVAFDAFSRAMKEVNSLSETVVTLSHKKRDYLIYYCEESAIQDPEYMPQLARIYEALKLLNYKVGFTTPNKIDANPHAPKAIIVPPSKHVKNTTVTELENYKQSNSQVEIVSLSAMGESVFELNEKGIAASRDLTWIDTDLIYDDNVFSLVSFLEGALPTTALPLLMQIKDVNDQRAYGVFANFGESPSGQTAFSLINVSKDDRIVKLPNWELTNMITGEVLPSEITMKPYDYYLIQTVDPCEITGGDADFDGVCNADDICNGGDDTEDVDFDGIPDFCDPCNDNIIGESCDDLDPCTINDLYDSDCNCIGTFADADSDGVCDVEDTCNGGDDAKDEDDDGIPDFCDPCNNKSINNTAIDGTASMSSTLNNLEARRINDGVINDFILAHTLNTTSNEWMDIDIGAVDDIHKIVIWNRTTCCQFRLDNVYVMVSKSMFPQNTDLSAALANAEFIYQVGDASLIDSLTIHVDESARYVRVQKSGMNTNNDNHLNVKEIQVFVGKPTPCDDGDECTSFDVLDQDCNCRGTFADVDNDGICDVYDSCDDYLIDLSGSMTTNSKHAKIGIESNQIISENGNVEYKAGDYILLSPGFEIKPMAVFHAYIESCQ